MKDILITLLISFISASMSYLSFSFVLSDLNSSNWDQENRAACLLVGLLSFILSNLFYHGEIKE